MTGTTLLIILLLAFWSAFGVKILTVMLQSSNRFVSGFGVLISLPTAVLGGFQLFGFIILAMCLAAPFITHIG